MIAIKEIDPVVSLFKLKKLAQNSIDELEKPLGIWEQIIEGIIAFAVNYKSLEPIVQILRPYSRRYSASITLEFIKRQTRIILHRVKPIDSEQEEEDRPIPPEVEAKLQALTYLLALKVRGFLDVSLTSACKQVLPSLRVRLKSPNALWRLSIVEYKSKKNLFASRVAHCHCP